LLITTHYGEKVWLRLATATKSLEGGIALKVHNSAEWLRTVLQKWAEVSPFPAWSSAIDSLGVVSEWGQLNKFVDLVAND
jgi:hypothetical protein